MDSWFFRDSKPMNAGESGWLESVFPPTGQTLQGAIRTAIIENKKISYEDFLEKDPTTDEIKNLQSRIGNASNLGEMQLSGSWIQKPESLYYPIPLDFVKNSISKSYAFLKPSTDPLDCDLGTVRMPAMEGSGYKAMENYFIDKNGMEKLLQGESSGIANHICPLFSDSPEKDALADREPKVGLARNNQTRKAIEGMLFAIAPIRPRKDINLVISIDGLEDDDLPAGDFLQPLGGEGKLAHVRNIQDEIEHPKSPLLDSSYSIIRFKMILTTHALMPEEGWLPKDFVENTSSSYKIWQGELGSETDKIPIDIITACIGKPFKIGGWNHAEKKAKPLESYVPAGSVYFCETVVENKEKLLKLHNSKIGNQTAYGFGHILLGQW